MIDRFIFLLKTFFLASLILSISPFVIVTKVANKIFLCVKDWDTRFVIKNNPVFDYGAITGLRESESSDKYRVYFQLLDKEMYLRLTERQILNGIIDFLDSKNIDTSDLKKREQVILNEGVIMTGGNVVAENIIVGKNAKSKGAFVRKIGGGSAPKTSSNQKRMWFTPTVLI